MVDREEVYEQPKSPSVALVLGISCAAATAHYQFKHKVGLAKEIPSTLIMGDNNRCFASGEMQI